MRAASAFMALSLCAACATGSSAFMTEGKSRQVPVLIYDTSWNNPYEFPTWRMGDPIPPDALHLALANTGDETVDTVWLHVAHCNTRGDTELDGWLRFDGPFQPGQTYADARAVDADMNYLRIGSSMHLVILGARLDGAAGKQEFPDDVAKLLTSGISNFCPRV
jgi:hypothetical protein